MQDEEIQLTMGRLPAANRKPIVTVRPHDTVTRARTLMEMNGYSQLPVVSGKGEFLKSEGAVTWESIARGLLDSPEASLEACIAPKPPEVRFDAPLLPAIRIINEYGYVVVLTDRGHISGIVTSADVGDALVELTKPYIELSECERQLRKLVNLLITNSHISREQVAALASERHEGVGGDIDGLPFGTLIAAIRLRGATVALSQGADPRVLLSELDKLAAARNSVMHFRPMDRSARESLDKAPALAAILRRLCTGLQSSSIT